MNLIPDIIELAPKKLVGMHVANNFIENNTAKLWRAFIPQLHKIVPRNNNALYSLRVYPADYDFTYFEPSKLFDQYALVEVNNFDNCLPEFLQYNLAGGLYAVFHYQGLSANNSIFEYIYGEWIPGSIYQLAPKPHFELLGDDYKNDDPYSKEDIYIPIKAR